MQHLTYDNLPPFIVVVIMFQEYPVVPENEYLEDTKTGAFLDYMLMTTNIILLDKALLQFKREGGVKEEGEEG